MYSRLEGGISSHFQNNKAIESSLQDAQVLALSASLSKDGQKVSLNTCWWPSKSQLLQFQPKKISCLSFYTGTRPEKKTLWKQKGLLLGDDPVEVITNNVLSELNFNLLILLFFINLKTYAIWQVKISYLISQIRSKQYEYICIEV